MSGLLDELETGIRNRCGERAAVVAGEAILAAGATVANQVSARSFVALTPAEIATLHELPLRVGAAAE